MSQELVDHGRTSQATSSADGQREGGTTAGPSTLRSVKIKEQPMSKIMVILERNVITLFLFLVILLSCGRDFCTIKEKKRDINNLILNSYTLNPTKFNHAAPTFLR
ncbi:hypothetical protein RB195_015557 [Necator americanus]|uniref:Uncharacterized protein n=1 Tax=Necator americanus TaxID=51031 RepID=A0ABR1E548_NECAM